MDDNISLKLPKENHMPESNCMYFMIEDVHGNIFVFGDKKNEQKIRDQFKDSKSIIRFEFN